MLATAQRLAAAGRYREAAETLGGSYTSRDESNVLLLRAELLAFIGDPKLSVSILGELTKSKTLTDAQHTRLEFIRARIAHEQGDARVELQHLHKAILHGEKARDLEYACRSQIALLSLLGDQSGPDSVRGLIATTRANVARLGNPAVVAELHVAVGQLDGKRGLTTSGSHHARRAHKLLCSSPHLWLDAWAQVVLTGIDILNCEYEKALARSVDALDKSLQCGAASLICACFGNMGYIHLQRGHFDLSLQCTSRIFEHTQPESDRYWTTVHSEAQVYLAQAEYETCAELILKAEPAMVRLHRTGLYDHRHFVYLKAQLNARCGRWLESVQCIDDLLLLSERANDDYMRLSATLLKAEVLLHLAQADEVRQPIQTILSSVARGTVEVFALYERALACLMVGTGDPEAGLRHRDRAGRIVRGLQNVPAAIELSRSWESAKSLGESKPLAAVPPNRQGANVLQGIAALMMCAGRPELLAPELVAVLEHANIASSACAVARGDAGQDEVLASFGETPAGPNDVRVFALGTARNRAIEISVQALPDFESLATLNSVAMLLGTIRDLEQAKAEREERLTLWPSEELPLDDQDAIITGRARELMAFARKVASTKVPVLITGESGTGKEIFARAIHSYSTRAKRPFVPLNCTAVPRDLLESQLFGHRRGAFTGADRDHLGVIRAAKEGTLFLDEIGELSLELQPKFLRFLESGEINPLGETSPFTIDVRIVAATNANLEQLVEAGKFREDLFYRLNVVSIAVPPLRERRDEIPSLVHHFVAKAAAEFNKGRIRIAEETLEHLQLFAWPGNIRQLQNELRRMVALADVDAVLTPSALAASIRQQSPPPFSVPVQTARQMSVPLSEKLSPAISRIEREMIQAALHANRGRAEATAKALGISRKGLYLKRQRLGI